MKAILEFNLPEDREDFKMALNANKYHIIVENLYNDVFRPVMKYNEDRKQVEAFEMVWDKVNTYIQEHLED